MDANCLIPVVTLSAGRARRLIDRAILAALLALPAVASGQDTPADKDAVALSPVVVTATRTERAALEVPASVDVVDAQTIRDGQLRVNLSESMALVPGLVVLNRQNYAQDLQISIRGFGSRATFGVRGLRLYVDGVPATFPDGQGQVSHFPLNLAERVEILRGPFSALYGNSSGGVIALTTQLKPQEPHFELNAAGGSFGTWRAGITALGGQGSNAFAIDANHFQTDGARNHSFAKRDTVNLRLGFLDSPLGAVRISLNSLAMPDSQDPLGLTRAQMEEDPTQASPQALQFNTRKTTRQTTLGASALTPLSEHWQLNTAAWLGTRGVMQYQAIPVATQIPASSPGGVIDFDRLFGGLDLRATAQYAWGALSFGLSGEQMDEDRRGYQNFAGPATAPTELGVLGAVRRDEVNTVQSLDPYAQLEWRAGERWRLHAGVRSSRVSFDSQDKYLTNGDDSGSVSYSAVNPTAGIVFRAAPDTSYYLSYGRGFETPTLNELAYRPDGSAGLNTDLQPSTSDNVEAGVKLVRADWSATFALYSIRTQDEIVVVRNAGGRSSFGNATQTRRDGAEIAFAWRMRPDWNIGASIGVLNARYSQDFLVCRAPPCPTVNAPELVPAGNRLPGVPAQTFALETRYRAGWADLSALWRTQSALWVNDANTDRAGGYGVVGIGAARTFDAGGRALRAFARVDNLFDRRYVGSVIVNEANLRFFEPAPGRAWIAGFDLTL